MSPLPRQGQPPGGADVFFQEPVSPRIGIIRDSLRSLHVGMLHALSLCVALAPSFEGFSSRAVGTWRGASFSWTRSLDDGAVPLSVAEGSVTLPAECSSAVEEVMRSCGGAVQGVRETRMPGGGECFLNRMNDGLTFFSCGTWADAPPQMRPTAAAEADLLQTLDAFGLTVCLGHGDGTRRRLLLAMVDGQVACCDVAVEGREDVLALTDGGELPSAAAMLLEKKLQVAVEASAWEGGASATVTSGRPPIEGAPWINARTVWHEEEVAVEGGSPLLPSGAAYFPGGCWARVIDERATGGGVSVEAGSVAAEAGEVKAVTHEYAPDGRLVGVQLRAVVPREE